MSLIATAEQFSQFCRTGKLPASFEKYSERIGIYHSLVRDKVARVLERAFPLTHHLLQEKQWNKVVDHFLEKEDFSSPFLWKLSETFVHFVQKNRWSELFAIPYLDDLVHFEWLEIEIYMMPDQPKKSFVREGEILEGVLYVNPESQIFSYSYPVFEKKDLPRVMDKGTYFLLGFRHPLSGEAHFISLSPFFRWVIEMLHHVPLTGRKVLMQAANKFHLDADKVLARGEPFLSDLFEQHAIYGFQTSGARVE